MVKNRINHNPSYKFDIKDIAASISCRFKLYARVLKLDNYALQSLSLFGNINLYCGARQHNFCHILIFIDGNFSNSLSTSCCL